ncbi:hypothetical protein FOXYSP1_21160, partial [Fusarium oxysporum f. sp. phaseoli]
MTLPYTMMLATNQPLVFSEEAEPHPLFDASTQSIGQHTHPNTIYITAQCPGTANYQDTATIDNKVESVLAVEASSLSHPIQNKQQVIPRPGRPQKDPALSPRERTRLRVQRHRDQQHLTKAQQIVEQFDITQELPPTVEFSGLTLHDDLASSVSPDGDQNIPNISVIFLPPLPSIFANRDQACDPHVSFPQWQSFLSDQPPEPLSLHKTQASLPHGSVTVARQWDVDSIWFGAKSLSAIQAPVTFDSLFSRLTRATISTAQVIQPHGLDLAHTRHTSIAPSLLPASASPFFCFPQRRSSHTKASATACLSSDSRTFMMRHPPAIYETLPDHVRQEIPSSYDLLYAKSRAYQEKPGAGRW